MRLLRSVKVVSSMLSQCIQISAVSDKCEWISNMALDAE